MTSMDKELASFIGIGLMLVAALLVTFARTKTKGAIKLIISTIAFFLLIIGFFYGILSMF